MAEASRRSGGERVLGVVGTFVVDRIVGLPGKEEGGDESLGGIAYGLASAVVAAPPGWRVLPVARVGMDAELRVRRWLADVGLETHGLVVTPEANNRVELRYEDGEERTERLTGGVGPWPWDELAPRVARCDALLVNFISGHELSLETARRLGREFPGPVYADLHSLFLGMEDDGTRVPRPLPDWQSWVACFDVVQMNGDELDLMRGALGREAVAEVVLTLGPAALVCTLGSRGALSWTTGEAPRRFAGDAAAPDPGDGSVRRHELSVETVSDADPTGCGDVFGGAVCAGLLAGMRLEEAMTRAGRLAAAAAERSGVDGLAEDLRTREERV